jgi:hypothetical protein
VSAFSCPFLEQHFELLTVVEWMALVCAIASLLFFIFAVWWFRQGINSELVGAAVFTAALPFVQGWLLSILGAEPNVHGVSFLTFFLYGLLSEVCAFVILISVGVRRLKVRWKEGGPSA